MAGENIPARVTKDELIKMAAAIPSEVRAVIAEAALASQQTIEHWPYYSRVRFKTIPAIVAGVVTYAIADRSTVAAFSYAVGQDMAPAGFTGASARTARLCDTSLADPSKTKDGATLEIYGISCHLTSESEPALAEQLFSRSSVSILQNSADSKKKIGPLGFVPQTGGLTGMGHSLISDFTKQDKQAQHFGFVTNGLPIKDNFWGLPELLYWKPSGKTDSTFQIEIETCGTITVSATIRPGPFLASDFSDTFLPPLIETARGTFVDLIFLLHSRQKFDRSANV